MNNMNICIEVDQYVLEELITDLKSTKLSLMYEFSVDFDKDRLEIQAKIDEYRLRLGLFPDPNPLTKDN